jgi:hypothetical protein
MVTRVGDVELKGASTPSHGASSSSSSTGGSLVQADVANMLRGPVGSVLTMHVRRSLRTTTASSSKPTRPSSGGFSPMPALAHSDSGKRGVLTVGADCALCKCGVATAVWCYCRVVLHLLLSRPTLRPLAPAACAASVLTSTAPLASCSQASVCGRVAGCGVCVVLLGVAFVLGWHTRCAHMIWLLC